MKEPFPFEKGRIVQSTQGRDKGKYFIVLEEEGAGFVRIADGRHHPLSRPKKKKTMHLRAKAIRVELDALRAEGGRLQDSDLRRALEKNGFAEESPLCEEG